MVLLDATLDLDSFFEKAAQQRRLLMLDYDGTLAPFRVARDEAVPYPGVPEVLSEIALRSRVVLVSGRPAREVTKLIGSDLKLEIWGSHGWERLFPDGRRIVLPIAEESRLGFDEAFQQAVDRGLSTACEVKPVGLALHWRGMSADDAKALRASLERPWRSIASKRGLRVHEFDGGLELRLAGHDKGSAIDAIIAEEPQAASIAYLGDDETDEDAFRVLRDRGLTVLVRANLRPTEAKLWLRPPEELFEFLERWLRAAAPERR